MPSKSRQQQKYVFYLRGKYKTKENTPDKFKWVWDSGWKKLEENIFDKYLDKIYNEKIVDEI